MFRRMTLASTFAIIAAVGLSPAAPAPAQEITKAPSTVDATYVAELATETLRPKYGAYYGFAHTTPKNAEMVAMYLFSYR